jgi:hypothetical protein
MIVECLAQTRDVAMTKNTKSPATHTGFLSVNVDILRRQIANDGLRGGQANGFICCVHRKYSD